MRDDGRLDRTLRDAFAAMSAAKGRCPNSEELVRFYTGELDAVRAAEVRRHVLRCAECDLLLDRMERFDGAVVDESPVRKAIEASASGRRPAVRDWWKPALSGAAAASLVFSILWLLPGREQRRPSPGVSQPGRTAELAQVFVLPQDRGAADAATLRLSGTESSVALSFFAPMAAGARYFATIEDASGRPLTGAVDISPLSSTGRVSLVVPAALLSYGAHRVRVVEGGVSGPGKTIEILPFEVERRVAGPRSQ